MKVSATHKNARMAPRKIRPLATLVRGMKAEAAVEQLQFMPGKAPEIVQAVLKSAIANAINNYDMKEDSLTVADAFVNEGIVMKRFQPVSRGMAHSILKRTSHVTVAVDGTVATKSDKKKAPKKADIATISTGEYVDQKAKQQAEEAKHDHDHDHDHAEKSSGQKVSSQDKETGEAHQKTKMNQQGGDKKKTHRRKSIG